MSQPLDLSRFPDLPPEVVRAFEAAQFELSVERAARLHEQAVVAEKEAFIAELKELIAKLEGQVGQYRHAKFGPKSEKLDPHSGVTVIFRSKRGDRLKILVWDGSGLVLIYKRLEQGSFAWPKIQDGVMRLSRAQYEALFEGLEWRRVVAQRVVPPAAAG